MNTRFYRLKWGRCFSVFLLIVLFLISVDMHAQHYRISGKVMDLDSIPQGFSKIRLISLPDSSVKAAVEADINGVFNFTSLDSGNYFMSAEALGLERENSDIISLSSNTVLVYDFYLTKTKQLKEVAVKGQRSSIRVEDGKVIINVENTLGNSGQTAVDVLRKAPDVAVDQNGNIQLRGKNGVQVMIDDKMMYLSPEALSNLLRSIPAEQIKEIELITNPSARYDASGSGGIIHIKLKRGAYEGFTGRWNASVGYSIYHRAVAGVNLTYKKKRLTLNMNYQYANRIGYGRFTNDRYNSDTSASSVSIFSKSETKNPSQNHNIQLTGDYSLTKRTSLNFDCNNTIGMNSWRNEMNSVVKNSSDELVNEYRSVDETELDALNSYSSLGFQHKFDTLGTLLSGFAGYNRNQGDKQKEQVMESFDEAGIDLNAPFIFIQTNKFFSNHFLAQLDVVKNVKKIKLESGIKGNFLKIHNPSLISLQQDTVVTDIDVSLDYTERILAYYIMGTRKFKKWNFQAGVRTENTSVIAAVTSADTSYTRNYTSLFPNASVSFKQSDATSYSISYSRRILRPTGEQLNPVLNVLDPYSVQGGDPYLVPQFANNTEFSYSVLGGTFICAVSYTYISHPLAWVNKYDPVNKKYVGGFRNLDYNNSYGASVSMNKQIKSWWSTTNNLFGNFNSFYGDAGFGKVINEQWSWQLKSTQRFNLPAQYSIEVFGQYESPSSYAFAQYEHRTQLNIAIQKRIWDKKGTVKLAVNDMFWGYYYKGQLQLGETLQKTDFRWDNRSVVLSFNYRFGNPLMKD